MDRTATLHTQLRDWDSTRERNKINGDVGEVLISLVYQFLYEFLNNPKRICPIF